MPQDNINISDIQRKIDSGMGKASLSIPGLSKGEVETALDSDQHKDYLQDQIYRWIIRAYLVNAKLQSYITDEQFDVYIQQASTEQGREQLAASILLTSVPLADSLPQMDYVEVEEEARPTPELYLVANN